MLCFIFYCTSHQGFTVFCFSTKLDLKSTYSGFVSESPLMHLVVLLSYFKLSIFITLVPHWINMIGLMSTKICQSSRIIISPYCLYHDIMCMRTDWSERWRECQKSRSSAAQSKMLIKISKSNTCMAA